jgi:hypothetical protein
LKLRRETPAGVALGVTDWKVVERVWRSPSGKRTDGLPWRVAGAERTRTRQIGRQTTPAQETAPAALQLTAYRDERPPRLRPRGQVRFAAPFSQKPSRPASNARAIRLIVRPALIASSPNAEEAAGGPPRPGRSFSGGGDRYQERLHRRANSTAHVDYRNERRGEGATPASPGP